MTSDQRLAERLAAVAAPVGLFAYGVFRYIDGRDGDRGSSFAWDAGHVFFLAAMLSFAVFAAAAAQRIRGRLAVGAATAVVAGVAAFTWVIIGDLSPALAEAAPVPDPVTMVGPVLLLAGLLPLFVLVARERMGRWWAMTPLFGLAGFALISIDLDLLLGAAAAFGIALVPLAGKASLGHDQRSGWAILRRQTVLRRRRLSVAGDRARWPAAQGRPTMPADTLSTQSISGTSVPTAAASGSNDLPGRGAAERTAPDHRRVSSSLSRRPAARG